MVHHKPQMSDRDTMRLIKEVKKRPCIWNQDDENYNDRYNLSEAWENMARTLGMPEEVIRIKWKNLRDCFKKEAKKNGCIDIDQYGGKWRHFKPLAFLLRPDAAGEEDDQVEIKEQTGSEADQTDMDYELRYVPDTSIEYLEEDPISPIPEKRARADEEDYDLMFLKSLTPFLKQLEPTRNLVVRSRMQDMLLNEIAAQNMSGIKNKKS